MDSQYQLPKDRMHARWSVLKGERSSWDKEWTDLSQFILPRSGRFFIQDRNRGDRRNTKILDNSGTKALRTLAAGMMAGMTSPARPWFRLATPDQDLNESPAVKVWLAQVTKQMLDIFAKSNTYRALHMGYEELGVFGTMSSLMVPDFQSVIHHHPLTAGEYAIATNWRGDVTTLYREFQKTVGEMVVEFGYSKCSQTVRNLWDQHKYDSWVTIVHSIEPRPESERIPGRMDGEHMPWKSCYFEQEGDKENFLRKSGFKRYPGISARWSLAGGDIYGTGPATDAIGDVKQLQLEQLRKAQAIDYKTRPPLQIPMSMQNREVNTLPGGATYIDMNNPHAGVKSMWDVDLDLSHLLEDIRDVRDRVRGAFHADLFLMLSSSTGPQMTATEVAERHEEKLLMLGPVLERLHSEELGPLIDGTFEHMVQAGIVPTPPEEMQGMELNVVFVSMLAQAQRAIATNSVDRYVSNLGAIAAFKPGVLDKFDEDKWADRYADMLGVDPEMVVADEKVAIIRQQRAQAAQAAQQAAQAEQMAGAAQKLGTVQTPGGNAANDVMQAFSGYTTA